MTISQQMTVEYIIIGKSVDMLNILADGSKQSSGLGAVD